MKHRTTPRLLLLFALSLSLISWDRASKDLAKEYLANKPTRTFLHDSFQLQYAENTGAAMSMGDTLSPSLSFWLLGILPLTILTALFCYLAFHARTIRLPRLIALTLIFAGGIGNILDRLLYDRHVTDFMIIKLLSLQTGIFNFADLWITTGVIWIAIDSLHHPKSPLPL